MLEIKDISFSHKNEIFFENLNISLNQWDSLIICGISWSGKTSLLNIVSSLKKPTKWDVCWKNKSIFNFGNRFLYSYRNQSVGVAFQDFRLIDDFSVLENINLPFLIWKNQKDQHWFDYLVKYLEIEKILNKNINSISWGEKERVSIIKSLVHKPEILMLDEPGTYLDKQLKYKLYSLIKEYSQNNISIIVSHDEDIVDFFWVDKFCENKNLIFYK